MQYLQESSHIECGASGSASAEEARPRTARDLRIHELARDESEIRAIGAAIVKMTRQERAKAKAAARHMAYAAGIPRQAHRLLDLFIDSWNDNVVHGTCYNGYERMADKSGIPERTVATSLWHLTQHGLLAYSRRRREKGRQGLNLYTLPCLLGDDVRLRFSAEAVLARATKVAVWNASPDCKQVAVIRETRKEEGRKIFKTLPTESSGAARGRLVVDQIVKAVEDPVIALRAMEAEKLLVELKSFEADAKVLAVMAAIADQDLGVVKKRPLQAASSFDIVALVKDPKATNKVAVLAHRLVALPALAALEQPVGAYMGAAIRAAIAAAWPAISTRAEAANAVRLRQHLTMHLDRAVYDLERTSYITDPASALDRLERSWPAEAATLVPDLVRRRDELKSSIRQKITAQHSEWAEQARAAEARAAEERLERDAKKISHLKSTLPADLPQLAAKWGDVKAENSHDAEAICRLSQHLDAAESLKDGGDIVRSAFPIDVVAAADAVARDRDEINRTVGWLAMADYSSGTVSERSAISALKNQSAANVLCPADTVGIKLVTRIIKAGGARFERAETSIAARFRQVQAGARAASRFASSALAADVADRP